MAAGDVKSGSGTLEIDRVRMDRKSSSRVTVLRQFVQPGQAYGVKLGETVELWVEYSGATNPRLKVDWGAGEPDSPDITGCGSCLLAHRYASDGRYAVTVTLDDRVSTTVSRTFQIDTTNVLFLGTCTDSRLEVGCSNRVCQDRICYAPTPDYPNGDAYCCGDSTGYPPGVVPHWDELCVEEAIALCKS